MFVILSKNIKQCWSFALCTYQHPQSSCPFGRSTFNCPENQSCLHLHIWNLVGRYCACLKPGWTTLCLTKKFIYPTIAYNEGLVIELECVFIFVRTYPTTNELNKIKIVGIGGCVQHHFSKKTSKVTYCFVWACWIWFSVIYVNI